MEEKINKLIATRRSSRFVSEEKIEEEKLQRIFEASRWAPSAFNMQPWYYFVGINNDEVYKHIFNCLFDGNKVWVKGAPVLAVTVANLKGPKGDLNPTSLYDLGQSIAMLSIQATQENVIVHQMTGLDYESLTKLLEIPEGYKIVTAFTLFYLGDGKDLPDFIKEREKAPRERRKIEETVFSEKFGNKASFL